MAIERVNVLGAGISVINLRTALAAIAAAVRARRKGYVCVTGVHGVMEAQNDPGFRKILNGAFLCTPDGMPMVWLGRLRGLMAIPEALSDFVEQRAAFRRLRSLADALRNDGLPLDTLSMGMTHDLEAAIAEGATLVRVGTAIFGERNKS